MLRRACSLPARCWASPRWQQWRSGRRTEGARAQPADPLAASKARFARPTFVPQPVRQSTDARQDRARQAHLRGRGAFRHRHHRLRHLPRSQARLHRRRAQGQGRDQPAPGAAHAEPVERGVEPAAVLGRPRFEPGKPDPLSRRAPRRDGLLAGERGRPLLAPRQLRARVRARPSRARTRRSRRARSPRRSRPTSARWCRRRRGSIDGSPARPAR